MLSIVYWIFFMITSIVGFLILFFRRKKYDSPNMIKAAIALLMMNLLGTAAGGGFASLTSRGFRYYIVVVSWVFLMILFAKIIGKSYDCSGDFFAPLIGLTQGLMKIRCIIDGCCYGIVLFTREDGSVVRFPSQIEEVVCGLIMTVLIILWERKERKPGHAFSLSIFWYGVTRYVFDWLRADPLETTPFALWMPPGRFFGVIITVIGAFLLIRMFKKNYQRFPKIVEVLKAMVGIVPKECSSN